MLVVLWFFAWGWVLRRAVEWGSQPLSNPLDLLR